MVARILIGLTVCIASHFVNANSYVFPAPAGGANPVVTLHDEQSLSGLQRKNIEVLIKDTYHTLDSANKTSALSLINESYEGKLPAWLYNAIQRCEKWFKKTEGNISCRNGALYNYWGEYVRGTHDLSRREVRRLARAARIAEVKFTDNFGIKFSPPLQWDLSEYAASLAIERVVDYLTSLNFTSFHISAQGLETHVSNEGISWHGDIAQEPAVQKNGTIAYIQPWQRPVISNGKIASVEKGVLSQSDGWPSAKFQAVSVAPNAFDAMLIAHFAVSKPAQHALDLVNTNALTALKLIDENGRVFTSDSYTSHTSQLSKDDPYLMSVDIVLPLFNIADYRGPYVSVWISDEKNHLIKSLALRGTSERWLSELRTWWRRVGRQNEGLVDGFAGATKKNAPLHIEWDGLDDFGKNSNAQSLILHIEVAREHGGRSYEKIPFTFDSLTSPITVTGADEIASITLSLMN
ncbi:DUF2271 domain-containing protein [Alteromonas sp. S015]|uniref:DUF2271 domain-containing protein n=1 Tax=Alteromonas sp. S015 TaxID=3117401 RepID=UPI002FE0BFDF